MQSAPVLEVVRARIDVGGAPTIDGLSFATTGERALVLGAARALFEAAGGLRRATHGEVRIRGVSAFSAVRSGAAASAPLDPALPPRWSPRAYALWSARLVGHDASAARALASDAIERLKIGPAADAHVAKAGLAVRRATVIAGALATGAGTLLIEDPAAGLPEEVARNLCRTLVQALGDRAWVVFAGRVPLASPLAMNADEALLVSGSELAAQGNPAEISARERAFALRIHGDAQAFTRSAVARGVTVGARGAQVTVDLGDKLAVQDIFAAAREAEATILEIRPLAGALS